MPILVRSRDDSNLEQLQDQGATEVVPETLEASLMMAAHLLLMLDVPMPRILSQLRQVRSHRYEMLHHFFHGQDIHSLEESDSSREGLHTVTLPPGAFAVGQSARELELADMQVVVTAIRRGNNRDTTPDPDLKLQEGDVMILYGAPEVLAHVEEILLKG
jgi:CPA2 family monovalent cation:H+ antiporter-2